MSRLEPVAWAALLLALSGFVVYQGRERAALERALPIAPAELYRTLARSRTAWQVVDVRPDLEAGYGDAHVPGAVPLPGCDPARAPAGAAERLVASAPTVIVSAHGDDAEVAACLARFTSARALAGGQEAWSDAGLPEDTGEYSPPSARAGGGCL